jgi:cation:H+ antiporter
MTWLGLAAGLVLLLGGGEALVKGSVAIATRFAVSPLLIGLTLVGFGTSTPELVASVEAALIGAPGIAIGNIVGSNIANILLILGIAALIAPLATTRDAFRRDGAALVGASLLLLAALLAGTVSRWIGAGFVAVLAAYTVFTYLTERKAPQGPSAAMRAAEAAEVAPRAVAPLLGLTLAAGGIAAIVIGADLLIDAAIAIATAAGISEAVIGLTLVAVGTSLPELATSVMAAVRRHGDVAFGNIVGSNIFNALGITGAAALVSPIAVPGEIAVLDVWIMIAATLLLVVFAVTDWRITRREGAIFLIAYAAYLLIQLTPGLRGALGQG